MNGGVPTAREDASGKGKAEKDKKPPKAKNKKSKDKKKNGYENQQVQGNTAIEQSEESKMATI